MKIFGTALMGFLFLVGCAGDTVVMNPRYDLSGVKRIAVLGFESAPGFDQSGEMMAGVFEKYFLKADFEIVERQKVKRIIEEQNFQMSGAVDPKDVVAIGKILGVQALVVGNVTVFTPKQKDVLMIDVNVERKEPIIRTKTLTKTVKGKKVAYNEDVIVGYNKIEETRQQPHVYYLQAEAGAVVKMIDAQTGEIGWVASATEQGANIQFASEYVGHRVVSKLKKLWRRSTRKKSARLK